MLRRVNGQVVVSSTVTGRPSVFKDSFKAVIKQEVEKARYNPDDDQFLQEHKRKVRAIIRAI